MNYTHPENLNREDDPKDWLASALVFAKAIGKLLNPDTGIVIYLENDMLELFECEKVLVCNVGGRITIEEYDGDYDDGDILHFINLPN
jgi:hypothetical protein